MFTNGLQCRLEVYMLTTELQNVIKTLIIHQNLELFI